MMMVTSTPNPRPFVEMPQHQIKGEWGDSKYPMVPGHEIVGVISAVGAEVTKFKVGDKAGVGVFVDSW